MRQLSFRKKPRGVSRRLRALDNWAVGFEDWFPTYLSVTDRYHNIKIPVLRGLIEGRHARPQWKAQAAQALINACESVIRSKPTVHASYRVTATVCVPDLFASELCIYSSEDYFKSKVMPSEDDHGFIRAIEGRSLIKEWGLSLPDGMAELGVFWNFTKSSDSDDHYVSEHWIYGEVSEHS